MESKNITTDITVIIADLTQKVLLLQEKIDFLCRSTGNCELINKVHGDLLPITAAVTKETTNGININTLREEE